MKQLPLNGTMVRAHVQDWALCQANNLEEFPDPRLPTLEGLPEWVEGPLDVRHVKAPWGEFDSISVYWDGAHVSVDADSIAIPLPNRRFRGRQPRGTEP